MLSQKPERSIKRSALTLLWADASRYLVLFQVWKYGGEAGETGVRARDVDDGSGLHYLVSGLLIRRETCYCSYTSLLQSVAT